MVTLSPRQAQLLRLYSLGATDLEAAAELGLSPWTVKEHGAALRAKLQARTRAHAVANALRDGILQP